MPARHENRSWFERYGKEENVRESLLAKWLTFGDVAKVRDYFEELEERERERRERESGQEEEDKESGNQTPSFVNMPIEYGWTPLIYACSFGHPSMVKLLLELEADPFGGISATTVGGSEKENDLFRTYIMHPLMAVCNSELVGENVEARLMQCAALLIRAGLENDSVSDGGVWVVDEQGMTPLALACKKGRGDLCMLLCQTVKRNTYADLFLNHQDVLGKTALIIAVEHGSGDCVDILLGMGACVEIRDNEGLFALQYASYGDNDEVFASIQTAYDKYTEGGYCSRNCGCNYEEQSKAHTVEDAWDSDTGIDRVESGNDNDNDNNEDAWDSDTGIERVQSRNNIGNDEDAWDSDTGIERVQSRNNIGNDEDAWDSDAGIAATSKLDGVEEVEDRTGQKHDDAQISECVDSKLERVVEDVIDSQLGRGEEEGSLNESFGTKSSAEMDLIFVPLHKDALKGFQKIPTLEELLERACLSSAYPLLRNRGVKLPDFIELRSHRLRKMGFIDREMRKSLIRCIMLFKELYPEFVEQIRSVKVGSGGRRDLDFSDARRSGIYDARSLLSELNEKCLLFRRKLLFCNELKLSEENGRVENGEIVPLISEVLENIKKLETDLAQAQANLNTDKKEVTGKALLTGGGLVVAVVVMVCTFRRLF
eukprot:Nk52_evm33s359 gene=Nk52_evmTU33s359